MLKGDFLRELANGLARIGWPIKHINRVARETSDHWDDLEAEACERGLDPHAASQVASEGIGTAETLIRLHQEIMRKASWSGRHPVLTFAVLPPLLLVAWFLVWAALAMGAGEVYGKLLARPAPVWSSHLLVLVWATVIHYTGVVAVPVFFSWWARRSFCGPKWAWVACGACALHGLLNHITVGPHRLQWGYGLASPDWIPVLAPLIVGVVAHFWERPQRWKPLAAIMLAAFMCGCASPKQPQQRGWIGGEYKETAAASGGILITRLSTNTPAARSGLQEGDLILRVEDAPVQNLRAFWKAVDTATPGQRLSLQVLRDGADMKRAVVAGKEVFKPTRNLTAGILLSREWDLWPNPGFSLIALGYKRQDRRIDLDSPESRFEFAMRDDDAPGGLRSREGWEVWLPVCSFSSRKRILAQTLIE